MSQKVYVIVDKDGKVARKVSGGKSIVGTFIVRKMAENNFWRYVPQGESADDYKIVEYGEVIE